jgi:Ca2+-binding RTX toxin-like protein
MADQTDSSVQSLPIPTFEGDAPPISTLLQGLSQPEIRSLNLSAGNPNASVGTVNLILAFGGSAPGGVLQTGQGYLIPSSNGTMDQFAANRNFLPYVTQISDGIGVAGDRNEQIRQIVAGVREDFANTDVRVIWDDLGVSSPFFRNPGGVAARDTVVYITNSTEAIVNRGVGTLFGVASSVDNGPAIPANQPIPQVNLNTARDTAFTFSSTIGTVVPTRLSFKIRSLIDTTSHEAGHTFGLSHTTGTPDSEQRQIVSIATRDTNRDSRFSPELLTVDEPPAMNGNTAGRSYREIDRLNDAVGAASPPGDNVSSQTLPNNTASPTTANLGTPDLGTITSLFSRSDRVNFLGDRDAFRFVAGSTTQFRISEKSDTGSNLNPVVVLFDVNGDLLQIGNTGSPAIPSTITFNAVSGQTFYAVAGSDVDRLGSGVAPAGNVGSYILEIGEALPTVTIAATDASASETGPDTGTYTITRSAATINPLTVNYTVAGTATNGTDYTALTGSAIIPANATTTTVTLTPIDDLIVDNPASPNTPETAILNLTANAAYILGAAATQTATVSIADNDSTIQFSNAAFSVVEGSGGGFVNSNVVTVTRVGITTAAQSVQVEVNPAAPFSTIGGNAPVSPTDYNNTAFPFLVSFAPGETSKTVNIPIFADTVVEGDETVSLRFVPGSATGTGVNIGAQNTATLTINNDDVLPPLVPTSGTTVVPSGGGNLRLGNNLDNVIVGNASNDTIYGYAGNDIIEAGGGNDYVDGGLGWDTLFGGAGNDTVLGGNGNDTLSGVSRIAGSVGLGEQDSLIGGAGADTYLLGDGITAYYNDGNNSNPGTTDFAFINGFDTTQDFIQLKGGLNYLLGAFGTGTGIFIDNDGTAGSSANDELIGVLQSIVGANPITTRFLFV